jgi:hypothetical protein
VGKVGWPMWASILPRGAKTGASDRFPEPRDEWVQPALRGIFRGSDGKGRVQELVSAYTFRTITWPSGIVRYQIFSVITDSTG